MDTAAAQAAPRAAGVRHARWLRAGAHATRPQPACIIRPGGHSLSERTEPRHIYTHTIGRVLIGTMNLRPRRNVAVAKPLPNDDDTLQAELPESQWRQRAEQAEQHRQERSRSTSPSCTAASAGPINRQKPGHPQTARKETLNCFIITRRRCGSSRRHSSRRHSSRRLLRTEQLGDWGGG